MNWATMNWDGKFGAVVDVFGTTNSDCGSDELLHLWEQVQARDLSDVYIANLAGLLGIESHVAYTPVEILQIMLASDEHYHWPAALRAAGVEVKLWQPNEKPQSILS